MYLLLILQYIFTTHNLQVATIFGIFGGCRREELYCLTVDSVVDTGSSIIVSIPQTKTGRRRMFSIVEETSEISYLEVIKKYQNLTPPHVTHNYFFVSCRKGKCTVQRIGINSFGDMGKKVAEY
jgi:hypothetical protein